MTQAKSIILLRLSQCPEAVARHPGLGAPETCILDEREALDLLEVCVRAARAARTSIEPRTVNRDDTALNLLKPDARESDFPPEVWNALLRYRQRVLAAGGAQCNGCGLRGLQRALGAEVKKLLAEASSTIHNGDQSAEHHEQPTTLP
jgi:hypothetical protein